jgi:two-component system cell cycle sensor histidine kinase/response regulator CckA
VYTCRLPPPDSGLLMGQIPEASSSINQIANPRRTIFVVEDEKLMVRLLEKFLSGQGYQVVVASDGEQAIEVYCRHKTAIDVVLLDVGLPKISGVNVFLKIKEENSDVRVVIASGHLEPALRTKMQQAGAEHFIQKPYMLDQVAETIQSLIETA